MTLSFPTLGSGWWRVDVDGSVRACVILRQRDGESERWCEIQARDLQRSSDVARSGACRSGGAVGGLPSGVGIFSNSTQLESSRGGESRRFPSGLLRWPHLASRALEPLGEESGVRVKGRVQTQRALMLERSIAVKVYCEAHLAQEKTVNDFFSLSLFLIMLWFDLRFFSVAH